MSKTNSEMPFLGHLEEMRSRILKAVVAVLIFTVVAFLAKDYIINDVVFGPRNVDFISFRAWCKLSHLLTLGNELCVTEIPYQIQSTTITGNFTAHIMVSIIVGIIISFPYIFHQIWSFIKPGLRKEEIKTVQGITFFTSLLFFLGVFFGYFVIVPLSLQFLGNYQFGDTPVITTVLSYMKLVAVISLAAGMIFQLPIFVYFLSKIGLVTPSILKKYRKHALVGIFVLAAIITPPDITSQILVAIPVLFLYEISIIVSRRVQKNNDAKSV